VDSIRVFDVVVEEVRKSFVADDDAVEKLEDEAIECIVGNVVVVFCFSTIGIVTEEFFFVERLIVFD
jgi:hypothetical protein